MSEPSLNGEPIPKTESGTQILASTFVSYARNALDTATQHQDPEKIIEWIRTGKIRAPVDEIRSKFWNVMAETNNNRKAAKGAIDNYKKRLPGIMWSGTFSRRKRDALLHHSGLLCADLDGLGDRGDEVRTKLLTSPHLCALFASPTGDGLKCVFRVPANVNTHKASFRAVQQHVRELSDAQIDESCSDVARLCFLSYDADAYFNGKAVELPPVAPSAAVSTKVAVSDSKIQLKRDISAQLLGEIDWTTDTRGFCACPGQHLHTTGDGKKDCEVYLDQVPTVKCFHNSCRGVINRLNRDLRARIAEAADAIQLPEIVSAEQFLREPLETPAELVKGLIHRNTLTMFGGGSKSYKTFTVLDLALSVSQGALWWGRDVTQGRVLYLNFEIAPAFFQQRISVMSDAKALKEPLSDFDIWNLRGCAADIGRLTPHIIERCQGRDYALVIVDPIYKLMGDREENSNNEMAMMLNFFEQISEQIGGAAVVFCHHFTKGSASQKAQIDRVSGGGVFGRHPDGIITLTPHEEETAFVAEATLRNFPPIVPFVLRWEYPLMDFAPDLDPKRLKTKAGRKAKYTVEDVLSCLSDGMITGHWKETAITRLGCAGSTFGELKAEAVKQRRVELRGKVWFRTPKAHSFNVMTGEPRRDEAGTPIRAANSYPLTPLRPGSGILKDYRITGERLVR